MTTHNADNERIKRRYFAYLKEANRYSESTVDAVAKALARFECDTKHRAFKKFHAEQAIAFKRRLADGDIEAWWAMVTNETFSAAAAAQFAQAWVGAIAQFNRDVKTPLEEVRDFFTHFSFPWWSDTMTTESLHRSMELPE